MMGRARQYDHDAILDRWQAGEPQEVISAATNTPTGTVRTIVCQARTRGDIRAVFHRRYAGRALPDQPPAMVLGIGWTDERFERAASLLKAGYSARQIAEALGGVTRNAVIGKLHRRGMRGGGGKVRSGKARTGYMAIARAPKSEQSRIANKIACGTFGLSAKAARLPVAGPPRPQEREAHEFNSGVRMMDLGALTAIPGQCRWVLGEPAGPDTMCCGEPRFTGLSYCEFHSRLVYQPASARQDRGARREYLARGRRA